jgi:hypothetical protein
MRRMRILAAVALIIALVAASACGGGAGRKVTQDEVASCLKDSGQFPVVKQGGKGQIQYAGSQGGVEATYGTTNRVTVNVLIGQDSGESSNLSSNMKESGSFVDVTREKNAVYAIPTADKDSPNRSAAGDATKSCL